jgi:hypothetical protein
MAWFVTWLLAMAASLHGGSRSGTWIALRLSTTPVPRDAEIVRRFREAGAAILGKTSLSEWANFRSTRSSSDWSAVGGQARNPHALDLNLPEPGPVSRFPKGPPPAFGVWHASGRIPSSRPGD